MSMLTDLGSQSGHGERHGCALTLLPDLYFPGLQSLAAAARLAAPPVWATMNPGSRGHPLKAQLARWVPRDSFQAAHSSHVRALLASFGLFSDRADENAEKRRIASESVGIAAAMLRRFVLPDSVYR